MDAVIKNVVDALELEAHEIRRCVERLADPKVAQEWARAIELLKLTLDQGGKIIVAGLGKSGKVGQKIAATLCSTGSLAIFLHPTEGLHGDLGVVRRGDCLLALSYTGNTEEILRLLPTLRDRGIQVIAVSGNRASRLVEQADAWLDASVEQEACPHNLAPTTSSTLALAIGDALAVALMHARGFDSSSFAVNHPGGSLGRRLSLHVADVMKKGDQLPVVSPSATMEEVILVSTQKKLGAALVANGGKLLGVITDGDLRRALSHKERFFGLTAREIMTASPTTIEASALASVALEKMERGSRKVLVLPVVNAGGDIEGLVHLHDLVSLL